MRIDAQIPAVGAEDLIGKTVPGKRISEGENRAGDNGIEAAGNEPAPVRQWNQTAADYPRDKTIQALFEEQAVRTPSAIAATFENVQLTFRQLNERADRIAAQLRECGVGPESLVGICVPRSLEMLVGLLGILKAGGAYVPLDPAYPKERIQFMLGDAQIKVLLTTKPVLEQFGFSAGSCRVVCVDDPETFNIQHSTSNVQEGADASLNVEYSPNNLAYVIYTSGSTGQPKGVMVRHRNVVNFFTGMDRVIGSQPGVWLAVTSISFDISVLELFWTLTRGFKVVIQSEEWNAHHSIAENITRHGVTHFQCTPSQAALLIEDMQSFEALKQVRKIFLGGEALPPMIAQRLWGHGELFNMYGPTETTIWSAATKLSGPEVTIGGPIANTQLHIVDETLRPMGIGEAGELLIGGHGVARGYLNRAELTAEKFIPDPFSSDPEARLYRTGDLARWRPDGRIEFLGRLDDQIKLRGHRIELGEIESTLARHPVVQRVVVTVREEVPGDQRLVAYIVPSAEATGAETLRQWQAIWDGAYARQENADPTFNISGWRSSYTGQPIAEEEMREWVRDAVEKIRTLQPQSVLEIGCGTGLLLFQLAAQCQRYCGTDFSGTAIRDLERVLASQEPKLPVTLLHQRADDPGHLAEQSFDVVVLNSVIQYFPNFTYFLRVFENALRAVKPGGAIFIGDVRNLAMLEDFYTSLELHAADEGLTAAELKRRVQRRREREKELVFAPEFFRALRQSFPQISAIDIQLKSGRHQNEMTRFRYDVVVRVAGADRNVTVAENAALMKELQLHVNRPSVQAVGGELPHTFRTFLKERLPEYMVPATFVLMPELPLTPNGKIDRKALPKPVSSTPVNGHATAAASDLEQTIAAIWSEVLQADSVGLNENFFDLGGHSLLLAQVHARLRNELGMEVPMLKLFQFPTVHALAEALSGQVAEKNSFADIQQRAMRQRSVLGTSNFRFRDHAACLRLNGTTPLVRA